MRRVPWVPVGRLGAGLRDKWITFQQRTSTTSGGFPVDTWVDAFQVFANKHDVEAEEAFAARQLSATTFTRWECPYRAALDPDRVDVMKDFRIVYATRIYDIVAAHAIGREAAIELMTLASGRLGE